MAKKKNQTSIELSRDDIATKKKKIIMIVAIATALVLILSIVLGVVLGVKSCNNRKKHGPDWDDLPTVSDGPVLDDTDKLKDPNAVNFEYEGSTAVGFYGEVTGTVQRYKPVAEVKNESQYFNNPAYPTFGSTLRSVIGTDADKVAARNALISESSFLTSSNTSNAGGGGYTWMDKEGYLYSGTVAEPVHALEKDGSTYRRLYKHTAAEGMYLGNVSDDEPGIVKKVTIRPRGYNGYSVTGVYAPAGEVIKIQISEADMNATGGLTIHIGQALYNGQANNIWSGKNQMQRIPHLLNTMNVNKNTATLENGVYTAYVGSFIGGPLYIRNTSATFTATISGGVAYRHFILGYTTPEDFEKNSKSTAPYFDLEVWDRGVLHSGPLRYAASFSYDDLYKAAVLWDKVASVTTYGSNQGIVFLYDAFVAAGAAVAFPGRRSVNCPLDWMASSLNYNSIVTSGSWGNFHEYHHNFQGYGVGNGGEVTNNGLTLVSYALFTKISSNRGISNYGAQGLSGWNRYTSASWALQETLKIANPDANPENGNQGLALYATLLHNFGPDSYMNAKVKQTGGQNYQAYMNSWQNVTHNNMYYYFKEILKGGVTDTADSSYPMFVPVSSVYQTGRSYSYDGEKKYINTMQPYVIPYGVPFEIDLTRYAVNDGKYQSGSIVIPDGFRYRIKNVTKPAHGSISVADNYHLTYTPDKNDKSMRSGKFIVTLEIVKDDGAFKVDDVDLILEFEQSHESNKMTLERTTYTYSAENMYSDAETAYENGFGGYSKVTGSDHKNPVQDCNTDIWYYPDNEKSRNEHPNAPEEFFVHDNTVEVIDGKLYFSEKGKYRIYLRGRLNCAVYYSLDGGKTYVKGATIKDATVPANSWLFRPADENTYFDVEVEAESWVYVKEVLIVQSSPAVSYIGLGYSKWTEPIFTMEEKYYNAEGQEVESPEAEGYFRMEVIYRDGNGKVVDAETANNTALIPPSSTAQPANINAYRTTYEFPDNSSFESDYFYVRNYNYNYVGAPEEHSTWDEKVSLVSTNYVAESAPYGIEKLFTEGTTTYIHPANGKGVGVYITMDMGEVITADSITFLGRTDKPATTAMQGLPKEFTLEISMDGENFTEAGTYVNSTGSAYSAKVNLGKALTFRYVKITAKSTHSNTNRLILSGITFSYTFKLNGNGNNHIAPSADYITYTGDWKTETAVSCFGKAYVGTNGSKIKFDFEGTRLAVLTNSGYESNFEVYIDGRKVDSINVVQPATVYGITYLSEKLDSGKHSVEIRCTGEAAFDSFATYNED